MAARGAQTMLLPARRPQVHCASPSGQQSGACSEMRALKLTTPASLGGPTQRLSSLPARARSNPAVPAHDPSFVSPAR